MRKQHRIALPEEFPDFLLQLFLIHAPSPIRCECPEALQEIVPNTATGVKSSLAAVRVRHARRGSGEYGFGP
jgi:hypothetical protein